MYFNSCGGHNTCYDSHRKQVQLCPTDSSGCLAELSMIAALETAGGRVSCHH